METITGILVILLCVVISSSLKRVLPVPLPLIQIGLGALFVSVADYGIVLHPDVFFLLFLPPLLFLDGWRIPKEGLLLDKGVILQLALGLVVFTVLGIGFFVHWLIPAMPLSVAFALAAIVSPTDPIAVSAITSRVPMPKRLMHILEGESLLNDASGLVCMRFAVAATLTGTFSIFEASGTFLWLIGGGVVIGFSVTLVVTWIKIRIFQQYGEDTGSQILISLLIPFGVYMLAEYLECSGILAAVAAGITMSYAELSGRALAITRIHRSVVWDTVQFAANGFIFVLLGEQLPDIIVGAAQVVRATGHYEPAWLAFYVVATNVALAFLRFVWVWISLRFNLRRLARKGITVNKPSWRLVVATSLAGVRGAVTLAGVLTLPLALSDGTPFPARDLAVFLAAGIIIVSLVMASVGLPLVLRGLERSPEASHLEVEDHARTTAAASAVRAVEKALQNVRIDQKDAKLYADIGARVLAQYHHRIEGHAWTDIDVEVRRKMVRIERELNLAALHAERSQYLSMNRTQEISDAMARSLLREVDLQETRLIAG
ncbi:Na+/H+ antiporter, partial [Brucella pituitosa]|uniref:Na+/H+ antiporter n=1 Tax=Brucella pituitosa TaxID=571256 RepID=UPI0020056A94